MEEKLARRRQQRKRLQKNKEEEEIREEARDLDRALKEELAELKEREEEELRDAAERGASQDELDDIRRRCGLSRCFCCLLWLYKSVDAAPGLCSLAGTNKTVSTEKSDCASSARK